MAFEIGVAANHIDLWDKLLAFLTTNPDLVASGQNWTVGWQVSLPPGVPGAAYCSAGYSPAADFFNGHIGNKWLTGSSGAWVEFAFESDVSVNHITITGQTAQSHGWPTNVSIQHHDGTDWVTDWTTATGITGTTGMTVALTDPSYAPGNGNPYSKRWRVLVNSNSGNPGTCIAQLNFYADPNGESLIQQPHTLNETDTVLVGPGMGGTDQIYVGMRRVDNPATDHYILWLNGLTGLMPSATQYTDHVNPSAQVGAYLDAAPMPYWFVANGRRFAAVMRVGTVYETFYAGLFLPYADPIQYSYPMFIGGSINLGYGANTGLNWKRTDSYHTNYTQAVGSEATTSAYMMTPDGVWYRVTDRNDAASAQVAPFQNLGGLDTYLSGSGGFGLNSQLYKLNAALGGGYSLEPATLTANNPADQTYGVLDGIYHVASEGTYAEDIVSVGGVDHLVFQNIWRTDAVNKAALALE